MYWKIGSESGNEVADPGVSDGRFVLHRHRDLDGPHLDLRLEQDGVLVGWRIDATSFGGTAWATEKRPHSRVWMERDGDAVREDAGTYAWLERGDAQARLLLRGRLGTRVVTVARQEGLAPETVRGIHEELARHGLTTEVAAGLVADGITARHRACERLCGLGRELDGTAFDEGVWRRALSRLSLDEIHTQLRSFEVRFDGKYPPIPVSRPERLPDTGDEGGREQRADTAFAIARD